MDSKMFDLNFDQLYTIYHVGLILLPVLALTFLVNAMTRWSMLAQRKIFLVAFVISTLTLGFLGFGISQCFLDTGFCSGDMSHTSMMVIVAGGTPFYAMVFIFYWIVQMRETLLVRNAKKALRKTKQN